MSSYNKQNNAAQDGWRRPIVLLMLMAIAMQLSHGTWHTLLNNFAINEAQFTGREIGILQSVREIPGFLAFGAILLLFLWREQTLALLALICLASGTAMTGYFPSEYSFYATTLLMSLGFHYYETINQSLALQWLKKDEAAHGLGRVIAAGSFASLGAYSLIYLTWTVLGFSFREVYLTAGLLTLAIVLVLYFGFPNFKQEVAQHRQLIVRKRYWLYYALTFMSGARRQIFIVFAGFLMVEKFGYSVTAITTLFLINHVFNMVLAPKIGRLIGHFGERRALTVEYVGLVIVFTAYAFVESPWIAAALYLLDHAFFAMAIAMKTYFQKIADPADIAPTAGVAFSINHIAAIFLPVILGFVWLVSPKAVFLAGAGLAFCSLALARLIPHNPEVGRELIWKEKAALAAAE